MAFLVITVLAGIAACIALDVVWDEMAGRVRYTRLRNVASQILSDNRDDNAQGTIQKLLTTDPDLPAKLVNWKGRSNLIWHLTSFQTPDGNQLLIAMVESGLNINDRWDMWNQGEYMLAATYQSTRDRSDVSLQQVLLDNGADPALADYQGRTPLHLAAENGDAGLPFAKLLLERGVEVNTSDK